MPQIIDLRTERLRRSGRRPSIALVGISSSISSILKAALDAGVGNKTDLLRDLTFGSYSDMLSTIIDRYEVDQFSPTRAVS